MSQRDMWKMLHLLCNTGSEYLTTPKLNAAGVDCYEDSLHALEKLGAVVRPGGTDHWTLTDGASAVLTTCTVARKLEFAGEVQVDRARVFCVMPFSEPWSDVVWKSCIEPAVINAHLVPAKGDTTLRTGNLIVNVWNEILESGAVVADLSAPNPNVYFELGMTYALGRDLFVMVQHGTNLPADLKGAHYLEYELADLADGAKRLQQQLEAWRDDPDIRVAGVEALFPPVGGTPTSSPA